MAEREERGSESGDGAALVTGAAGFIGSHVCEALLRSGRSVVGVDNLDSFYAEQAKRRNLSEIERSARAGAFRFERADIRDAPVMERLLGDGGIGTIFHLAARAGVRPSIEDPALYASVNVEGTATLLEAARRAGTARFILASSSSVYGNNGKVPFAETDDVSRPISPYAATKRACELLGSTFHHLYGIPVACLRFFTVYGPRQRPDLAIAKFMRLLAREEAIPMFGDGSTSRDYTFIDDIVQGALASERAIARHGYRIWNLGGSEPVSLREMIEAIGETVGVEPRIDRLDMQPGDVTRTFADLSRSETELGFRPTTEFRAGLRAQWEWMRSAQGRSSSS